jgi:hypothetical protein
MPNLTKKEKDQLFELSQNFIKIHSEINYVEETIKKMEQKSSELIGDLENCRLRELDFRKSLEKKYGDGCLDVTGLQWKKNVIENVELLK